MQKHKRISELKRPLYLTFEESEWNKMEALFHTCGVRTMKLAIIKAADHYVNSAQGATA